MTLSGCDVAAIRKDFPIFDRPVNGHRLVFLDSAASAQRPRAVTDAMTELYETTYANVHRGVYTIAEETTARYEGVRRKIARWVNARSEREIIFSKNVTESINLVAQSWGRANLAAGDIVVLTEMEHHANLVPWLMLKEALGIELRYIPIDDQGLLVLDDLDRLVDGAKLVGVTAVSNVLGTVNPVRRVADAAHAAGALVLVDGAQSTPHFATDVRAIGADFYGFTGHKMLGPNGIGVLWARDDLLEAMPPFLGGGSMITDVRLDGYVPDEIPWKFEAGTPPIGEVIGLGAAIDYLDAIGFDAIREHERALTAYAFKVLTDRYGDDITIFGPADPELRSGVMSFAYRGLHPHDISQVLDHRGVCIRAGHHCAKPLMRRMCVSATARASWYVYNGQDDIDVLCEALADASELFF